MHQKVGIFVRIKIPFTLYLFFYRDATEKSFTLPPLPLNYPRNKQ